MTLPPPPNFFSWQLGQIELCNSFFAVCRSSGKGFYPEEVANSSWRRLRKGGGSAGRVQKSVTKWSLIACKTAPRSGDRRPFGVRAGACVLGRTRGSRPGRAPTSASGAGGALPPAGPARAASLLRLTDRAPLSLRGSTGARLPR